MSESENKSFDLGERVSVVPAGTMPHPQGGFNPWAAADDPDAPFQASADPAGAPQGPGRQVGYDPTGAEPAPTAKPEKETVEAAPPVRGKRPIPTAKPASTRENDTLKKFREVFGLQRIEKVEATVSRKDPENPNKEVTMRFGLRAMNFEDYQWVLSKTAALAQNPQFAYLAWKVAVVSIGVCSVDDTPLWEVFGFEPEEPEHVRDPMKPHVGLRLQTAEKWSEELMSSTLFDTIEAIYIQYENSVDSQYLPSKKEDTPKGEGDGEVGDGGPLHQTGSES